ncbi:MAG: ABC transporter ATP-binding protein [Thermaerobacter sp.]|nr:ABC transporter [Bacillota bacterium]REJ35967.1 MAG: ABC transporter [Bacillota bacterium]
MNAIPDGRAREAAVLAQGVSRWFTDTRRQRHQDGSDAPAGPRRVVALDRVSLEVQPGELFGLLGPNGAGKSTLIKILSTLLLPSEGTVRVAGYDVVRQAHQVRRRINMVSGGETVGYGILTVRETLWMFSQFYGLANGPALKMIDEYLETFGLADNAHTRVNKLSTGMRQKMNFIRGLLNDPDVLFLDEPTLGLDVQTARIIRDFIRDWMRRRPGRTVLLTTHYMAEAEELCDRIAIIDRGRILACDTPDGLKRRVQSHSVFRIEAARLDAPPEADGRWPGIERISWEPHPATGRTRITVIAADDAAVTPLLADLRERGADIIHLSKVEPTLEDVFLQVVGRGLGEHSGA